MKILFATALLLAVAATGYSQVCHMREIDLCIAIGMFHFQSNGVAGDEEKLTEWCETLKEVEDCMGNYTSKCLSPLQKEILGLMAGAESNARQICTPGSEMRAKYLKHAECLSEGAESDDFKGNMKDLKNMVETLFEVEFKKRFPLMCCGFRRFHHDIETNTEKRCGKESVEMVKTLAKMIVTDVPEVMCQRFESESEECKTILPPRGSPSKGGESNSQLVKLLDTVLGEN